VLSYKAAVCFKAHLQQLHQACHTEAAHGCHSNVRCRTQQTDTQITPQGPQCRQQRGQTIRLRVVKTHTADNLPIGNTPGPVLYSSEHVRLTCYAMGLQVGVAGKPNSKSLTVPMWHMLYLMSRLQQGQQVPPDPDSSHNHLCQVHAR